MNDSMWANKRESSNFFECELGKKEVAIEEVKRNS